jgi:hypothetical protein
METDVKPTVTLLGMCTRGERELYGEVKVKVAGTEKKEDCYIS